MISRCDILKGIHKIFPPGEFFVELSATKLMVERGMR
jgi:hypothetical protein